MENTDKYDFLRQPDFVKKPLLKGSYAVYMKEISAVIGTGKLCHIRRPKIIDASGTVWDVLSVYKIEDARAGGGESGRSLCVAGRAINNEQWGFMGRRNWEAEYLERTRK